MSVAISGGRSTVEEALDGRPLCGLQIGVIVLCGLVAVFDGFDIQAISFAAPAIGREWGLPKEAFGFIFSTGIIGMIAGLLLQGMIADKVGRRPMVLGTVALFGAATLATAFASSITDLVAMRLIAGIGMGAALPNVIALTGEYSPFRLRARLIVLMNAGLPLGGFLGGVVSAPLIENFGWRSIFVAGGAAPLLVLPILFWLLPESLPFLALEKRRGARVELNRLLQRLKINPSDVAPQSAARMVKPGSAPMLELFRKGRARNSILICLMFFANMLLFYFLIGWLPTLLTQSGLLIAQAVLVSAGLNLGSVVGGFALGWSTDRNGPRPTLLGTFIVATVLFLLLGANAGWAFGAVALLGGLLGLCIGGAQLVLNAVSAQLYPLELRASGVGTASMAGRVGAVIGPITGGLLMAMGLSAQSLYLLLVIPAAIAAGCAMALRIRKDEDAREPDVSAVILGHR
jgi:AAHS family 4-hydroxybenzoate transporter-like MFS transporter